MVESLDYGRITLYLALAWTIFVFLKAFREARKHYLYDFKSEDDPEKKEQHKKVHILYLIGGMAVCVGQIFGYVWFDLKNTGLGSDDRTVGVFNIFFINLYMLFTINHFRHERKGTQEKGTWKEILKF